jgi:subtilisin family serine protease
MLARPLFVAALVVLSAATAQAENYIVQMPFNFDGPIVRELPSIGARVIDLAPEQVTALVAQGVVLEKDQRFFVPGPASTVNTSPGPVANWHLNAVHSIEANALPNGSGQGITVCVLDSGVNAIGPLNGAIVGGLNVTDPANPNDFHDGAGHGTLVASTIAARATLGSSGIAPQAGIYAVKFMHDDGSGSYSDAIAGLAACIGKSQIVNLSFGGINESPAFDKALADAKSKGLTLIAAAGNDSGPVGFPGKSTNVLAVSSSNYLNQLSSFSSFGPEIAFIAPGEGLQIPGDCNQLVELSGTSFSAAVVSGVEAIRLSRKSTSLRATDLGLPHDQQGVGLVDAFGSAQ